MSTFDVKQHVLSHASAIKAAELGRSPEPDDFYDIEIDSFPDGDGIVGRRVGDDPTHSEEFRLTDFSPDHSFDAWETRTGKDETWYADTRNQARMQRQREAFAISTGRPLEEVTDEHVFAAGDLSTAQMQKLANAGWGPDEKVQLQARARTSNERGDFGRRIIDIINPKTGVNLTRALNNAQYNAAYYSRYNKAQYDKDRNAGTVIEDIDSSTGKDWLNSVGGMVVDTANSAAMLASVTNSFLNDVLYFPAPLINEILGTNYQKPEVEAYETLRPTFDKATKWIADNYSTGYQLATESKNIEHINNELATQQNFIERVKAGESVWYATAASSMGGFVDDVGIYLNHPEKLAADTGALIGELFMAGRVFKIGKMLAGVKGGAAGIYGYTAVREGSGIADELYQEILGTDHKTLALTSQYYNDLRQKIGNPESLATKDLARLQMANFGKKVTFALAGSAAALVDKISGSAKFVQRLNSKGLTPSQFVKNLLIGTVRSEPAAEMGQVVTGAVTANLGDALLGDVIKDKEIKSSELADAAVLGLASTPGGVALTATGNALTGGINLSKKLATDPEGVIESVSDAATATKDTVKNTATKLKQAASQVKADVKSATGKVDPTSDEGIRNNPSLAMDTILVKGFEGETGEEVQDSVEEAMRVINTISQNESNGRPLTDKEAEQRNKVQALLIKAIEKGFSDEDVATQEAVDNVNNNKGETLGSKELNTLVNNVLGSVKGVAPESIKKLIENPNITASQKEKLNNYLIREKSSAEVETEIQGGIGSSNLGIREYNIAIKKSVEGGRPAIAKQYLFKLRAWNKTQKEKVAKFEEANDLAQKLIDDSSTEVPAGYKVETKKKVKRLIFKAVEGAKQPSYIELHKGGLIKFNIGLNSKAINDSKIIQENYSELAKLYRNKGATTSSKPSQAKKPAKTGKPTKPKTAAPEQTTEQPEGVLADAPEVSDEDLEAEANRSASQEADAVFEEVSEEDLLEAFKKQDKRTGDRRTTDTPVENDRRSDNEKRQMASLSEYFDSLTYEEKIDKVYKSPITGILNWEAFGLLFKKFGFNELVSIDLDGLKAINDKLGHESGDKLLKTFSKIVHEELDANVFHKSGDEFYLIGKDKKTLQAGIERAQARLAKEIITSEGGTLTGINFSYGFGTTIKEANTAMELIKDKRPKRARGAPPPNLVLTSTVKPVAKPVVKPVKAKPAKPKTVKPVNNKINYEQEKAELAAAREKSAELAKRIPIKEKQYDALLATIENSSFAVTEKQTALLAALKEDIFDSGLALRVSNSNISRLEKLIPTDTNSKPPKPVEDYKAKRQAAYAQERADLVDAKERRTELRKLIVDGKNELEDLRETEATVDVPLSKKEQKRIETLEENIFEWELQLKIQKSKVEALQAEVDSQPADAVAPVAAVTKPQKTVNTINGVTNSSVNNTDTTVIDETVEEVSEEVVESVVKKKTVRTEEQVRILAELEQQEKELDAELASLPKAKLNDTVDPEVDDLLYAIIKSGRLSKGEASERGVDSEGLKTRRGIKVIFHEKGKTFDEMAETLSQDGYVEYDANALEDKVHAALSGEMIYAPLGAELQARRDDIDNRYDQLIQQRDEILDNTYVPIPRKTIKPKVVAPNIIPIKVNGFETTVDELLSAIASTTFSKEKAVLAKEITAELTQFKTDDFSIDKLKETEVKLKDLFTDLSTITDVGYDGDAKVPNASGKYITKKVAYKAKEAIRDLDIRLANLKTLRVYIKKGDCE